MLINGVSLAKIAGIIVILVILSYLIISYLEIEAKRKKCSFIELINVWEGERIIGFYADSETANMYKGYGALKCVSGYYSQPLNKQWRIKIRREYTVDEVLHEINAQRQRWEAVQLMRRR